MVACGVCQDFHVLLGLRLAEMKQYTFVLNFGYVESSMLSYFPFVSSNKYRDAKSALIDLSLFLKEQYHIRYAKDPRDCCLKSKENDSEAKYCSRCSSSLVEEPFDDENFVDWLRRMSTCDVDTFHADIIEYDEEHRWQPDGLEGGTNLRFVYQAEWVIAAAIGYPHREGRTFEDICKDRTKAKRDSFSYYA
jgi:hypothetical protein